MRAEGKTSMTRRESRKSVFRLLFQKTVNDVTLEQLLEDADPEEIQTDAFCLELLAYAINNLDEIDADITPHLKRWTLARLPRVSLTVLRLSVAQLKYMPDLPESVIINEAVELTKEFGAEDEYSFVNGALRSISGILRPAP